MSSNELIASGVLLIVLVIGGVQDWHLGEVSNWISIPLFLTGVAASVLRVFYADDLFVALPPLFAMGMITHAAFKGWMGGADWKVLIGLFGLYPLAGFAALIVAGVWGGIAMLITQDRNVRFPGVTAFAFAACLTVFGKISIILFE